MLIKPKGPRSCKGLNKTSLYKALGWQKLRAFQLWNENASDVAVLLAGCSKERVIRCPPAFAPPLGCDTPKRWLEGKEAERPVSDFAPHVSERGRSLSHFTKSISILSWYFTHLRSE